MHGMGVNEQAYAREEFAKAVKKASLVPPVETFVKYENTVVIATKDALSEAFRPRYHETESDLKSMFTTKSVYNVTNENSVQNANICFDKSREAQELEMILNRAFPPLIWRDNGKIFRRKISTTPGTKLEMAALEDEVEEIVERNRFKCTGLDTERSRIFQELLDELIRQETVHSRPRGLLLLRIRDEIRMSIDVLEKLYLSTAAYSIRKAVEYENKLTDAETSYENLLQKKEQLLQNISDAKQKLLDQDTQFEITLKKAKTNFRAEIDQLRKIAQGLRAQLERHTVLPKLQTHK